ncbi:DUF6904 family protein [Alicyclobacillus fructus]|uniref:DUF6904 family protein n=2 Tax=Alicyclobacillus TaxID=29330 RepID=UPI001A8F2F7B|nr:hypothetical protein [Alicyclobacillus fructus]
MLRAKNTPNLLGIEVSGDYDDLQALYHALHEVVGEEGEYPSFEEARLRVLGVCYDVRHALQGHRRVELYPNGLTEDMMRFHGLIAPQENVRFSFETLYPEALFVAAALNDFLILYADKRGETPYGLYMNPNQDLHVVHVHHFQALIIQCVREAVSPTAFKRFLKATDTRFPWSQNYTTQYLDYLNLEYAKKSPSRRASSIATMMEKMIARGPEYHSIEQDVIRFAQERGCALEDVTLQADIDWDAVEW